MNDPKSFTDFADRLLDKMAEALRLPGDSFPCPIRPESAFWRAYFEKEEKRRAALAELGRPFAEKVRRDTLAAFFKWKKTQPDTRKTPVESFISEYLDLCRRHGMRLEGSEYAVPDVKAEKINQEYVRGMAYNIPFAEADYWGGYMGRHFLCHVGIIEPVWIGDLYFNIPRPENEQ